VTRSEARCWATPDCVLALWDCKFLLSMCSCYKPEFLASNATDGNGGILNQGGSDSGSYSI